jgi:serine/threonine protein kinase
LQKHRIAHRDIKPDNVMLSPSHHLTLIDFGVALLVGTHDPPMLPLARPPTIRPRK